MAKSFRTPDHHVHVWSKGHDCIESLYVVALQITLQILTAKLQHVVQSPPRRVEIF